jgi:hypothetical protein
MRLVRRGEFGQASVEFGIIGIAVMILTVGLVDVGRAFYQYNAVSSAARFGSRWASVVGGACLIPGQTNSDWCNQLNNPNAKIGGINQNFWEQTGSTPLQGNQVACPSYASNPSAYYNVSDPDNDADNDYAANGDTDNDLVTSSTTIVGAIGQHFDTSDSSSSFIRGNLAGFDFSKLKVCIQTTGAGPDQNRGDFVSVTVFYHFNPVNFLIARGGFDIVSTSQYEVEG